LKEKTENITTASGDLAEMILKKGGVLDAIEKEVK
jgi:hypothetical protein